jgi:hypothetical protein
MLTVARRAARAVTVAAFTAGLVLAGAGAASADPRPDMPRYVCAVKYGPGGSVIHSCYLK